MSFAVSSVTVINATASIPPKEIDFSYVGVAYSVEVSDAGKPTDFTVKNVTKLIRDRAVGEHAPIKTPLKSITDISKVLDWMAKVATLHLIITDIGKSLDYMCIQPMKVLADIAKTADWLTKSSLKVFADVARSLDYIERVSAFFRDVADAVMVSERHTLAPAKSLADAVRSADWHVKEVLRNLLDPCISYDFIAKDATKIFADTGISADFLARGVLKRLGDAGRAIDWYGITSTFIRIFAESVKGVDLVAKDVEKPLRDWAVGEWVSSKSPLKNIADVSVLLDWLQRVATLHLIFTDVAKPLDYICKQPLKSITDLVKATDLLVKDAQKVLAETIKTVEQFVRTLTLFRIFTETVAVSDWHKLAVLKSLIDSAKTADWLVKEALKAFVDACVSYDFIAKDALKVFADAGKSTDYLMRDVLKRLEELVKATDWMEKVGVLIKIFTETVVASDIVSKDISKRLDFEVPSAGWVALGSARVVTDTCSVIDWLERLAKMTITLLDSFLGADYISKGIGKAVIDYAVGEFVISRSSVKEVAEAVSVLDYICRDVLKPLVDSWRVLDWIERLFKGIISLLDSCVCADFVSRGIAKAIEFEAPSTGWVSYGTAKTVIDTSKVVDVKLAKDVLKAYMDYALVRDWIYRGILVSILDRVFGEFTISRGASTALLDRAKMADILTKVAFKLYGRDTRRVYFHRVWGDIIEDEDHNVKVEVAKIMLDAIKRLKSKLEQ